MLPIILLMTLAQEPPPPASAAQRPPEEKASATSAQESIDAGLTAFRRLNFARAEIEFRKALDADPNSAAANFYLGYTYYKIAEPKRPFHPDKQKAAALFAKAYQLDPDFRPVWGPRTRGPISPEEPKK